MRCIVNSIPVILLLMVLSMTSGISGAKIPDILLVGRQSKSGTGAILLLLDGKWKSICRKGNEKSDRTWSTKEATVACRQLGYQGGWATKLDHNPMANIKSVPLQLVDDFRCSGDERSLDDCYHDRDYYQRERTGCGANNFASVKCFDSFEVRLVGGTKPNAGRVQIQNDDNEWTDVCYDSKKKNRLTPSWGFHEVQVVCRELGYPGALMKQRGGYGNAEGQAHVHGFDCLGNEESLTGCLSSSPEKSARRQAYSCGARNEAVAICADPGYAGCFYYTDFLRGNKILSNKIESHEMTIQMCREHCRLQQSYRFAALYEGHMCMCGWKDLLDSIGPSSDSKCRDPCAGNEHEICGGYHFLSVYDVEIGLCVDPYNKSNSYHFGEVVSAVKCPGDENEVGGSPDVQCIMGDSWNQSKWSGPFPHCQAQLDAEPEQKDSSTYTLTALWVAIGCLCLLAVSIIAAAEITIRRMRHHSNVLQPTKSLTIDFPEKRQPTPTISLRRQIVSIRNSIRESIKGSFADHFYETTLRARTSNMLHFCSTKVKYQRTRDLPQGDTYGYEIPRPVSMPEKCVKFQNTFELPQEDNYEISHEPLPIPKLDYTGHDDRLKVLNPSKLIEENFKSNKKQHSSRCTYDPRKTLLRTDDDVVAYIVRTKL